MALIRLVFISSVLFTPPLSFAKNLADETWQSLATTYMNACTGFQVKSVLWINPTSCERLATKEFLRSEVAQELGIEEQNIVWSEFYIDLSYLHVDDSAHCSLYREQFEYEFQMRGLTGISPHAKALTVNYWYLKGDSQAPDRCMRWILTN